MGTIPFSRGSSQPRNQTHVSCIGRQILYHWATTRETYICIYISIYTHTHTHTYVYTYICIWASQVALVVKNPPAKAGDLRDLGSIPESGRSPGGWRGNLLQLSCLENPLGRGAWQAIAHRVTKQWRWLKWFSTQCTHICIYLYVCVFVHGTQLLESQLPDQGLNPHLLYCRCGILTIGLSGKSSSFFFFFKLSKCHWHYRKWHITHQNSFLPPR